MVVVIKKLTHPYSLTHKDYKQKDKAFFGGFPRERGEREIFQNFQAYFSRISSLFSPYFSIFHLFSLYIFLKKGGGGIYRGNEEMGGQHKCNMLHLCQPPMARGQSFYDFWTDLCAAVWRPFQAPFSSNFKFSKNSGCLVFNCPSLT